MVGWVFPEREGCRSLARYPTNHVFLRANMDKRLTPPPTIHGDVYETTHRTSGLPGFALNLRTHEGEPFRLWKSTRGKLRRALFYFRTLDRAVINALIPPGPAITPKTEKPPEAARPRPDVPDTLKPSMSLRERINARKSR